MKKIIIVKVGGEVLGVLINPSEMEIKNFIKGCKDLYKGEKITIKEKNK